ncbi:MAG TPA: Clp protease N-terminal domain-containing protein [Candidatus Dormibacteraeota bacterium]|nr:Clp protease N-terminal domain-containing protein [Candidatus Dormibacteraeota bacterium]
MYPFERFTPAAQATLSLAHSESLRLRCQYIGSEHLLAALVLKRDSIGGDALARLGLEHPAVCQSILEIVGSRETPKRTGLPISKVKHVIGHAFNAAGRERQRSVGTDHLLLGILLEDEDVGARILQDGGLTQPRVEEALAAARDAGVDDSAA